MNREHFRTLLWLRWRLRVNQFRKGGALNVVLLGVLVVSALIAAFGLLVGGFFAGLFGLPEVSPTVRLLIWDGLVVAFLFMWMIRLLTEIQRSESLSLDKFLHLPVSVSSAFLINYFGSLASLTLLMFVAAVTGLALGQTFAVGPAMLLAFPLLAAMVFAITAVTYQFQGWLASLMTNPRRRRTVIFVVSFSVIAIAQLPNLINLARPWKNSFEPPKQQSEERAALYDRLNRKELNQKQFDEETARLNKESADQLTETGKQTLALAGQTATIVSIALPPGWLAIGSSELADGTIWPSLLGIVGYGLIGTVCLRRAYRTTINIYTGQYTSSGAAPTSTPTPAEPDDPSKIRLVEKRLPWVSEHASAVAMAGLRSLSRAPEAKMALIAPVIMFLVLGGFLFSSDERLPSWARPLVAFGTAAVVLMGGIQLVGNQFGYDRTGFRAYVLSPIPRREILIGKNLAVIPFTLGLGVLNVLIVGCALPMRPDRWLAAFLQIGSLYLVFSIMANALSIMAPIPIAAGSLKASNPKIVPVLLQMVFFMFAFPLTMAFVLIPYGVEMVLVEVAEVSWVPASLILSILWLAGTAFVYRRALNWQGRWLQSREREILAVVTSKAE